LIGEINSSVCHANTIRITIRFCVVLPIIDARQFKLHRADLLCFDRRLLARVERNPVAVNVRRCLHKFIRSQHIQVQRFPNFVGRVSGEIMHDFVSIDIAVDVMEGVHRVRFGLGDDFSGL